MKIVGIIPARWQSSRFPGKPLADILGKSLIQRTYENTLRASCLEQVIVATDDERIQRHVEDFGGEVVMTSPHCHPGTVRVHEAANRYSPQAQIVVNIQGDEPCLDPEVISQLVEKLQSEEEAVIATPVALLEDQELILAPSVVKCVFDQKGKALYFSRSPIPFRQGPYYRHIGVYAFKMAFLETYVSLKQTPLQQAEDLEQLRILESGYPVHVCVVEDQACGVDTPEDIKRVEEFLCQKESIFSSQAVLSPR